MAQQTIMNEFTVQH